jgi:23S rRNA U2552 (ribose-2'-O)-methylase RlmE/FtsJ
MLLDVERELGPRFETFRRTKPPASREPSSELYVVGLDFHR